TRSQTSAADGGLLDELLDCLLRDRSNLSYSRGGYFNLLAGIYVHRLRLIWCPARSVQRSHLDDTIKHDQSCAVGSGNEEKVRADHTCHCCGSTDFETGIRFCESDHLATQAAE